MDRETRKANLKKLQLPRTAEKGTIQQQRKTRQNSKPTTETTGTISNYFLTPENTFETKDHDNAIDDKEKDNVKLPPKPSRLKRTKLDAFVFKDPQNIPNNSKNLNKPLNNEDDLVVPEKKVKKAPKLPSTSGTQTKRAKTSKTKKQTTIKSAFLRNEVIFAEIAAQHCAADQFDGDDIQLALAISKSEAESQGIPNVGDNNDSENVVDLVDCKKDPELLIEKLKKYGFRTAEKKDYNTFAAAFLPKANGRRQKSKWANKFTPLTLRNPETQTKKLQDNIKSLLNEQLQFKQLRDDEQHQNKYNIQSSLLKKCDAENKETIIKKNDNTNTTTIHQYFVIELFEINELSAGHLLKDWSAIQGRDLTPTTTKSQLSRDRSRKLENIYKELEEFFSCRKRLDLTITNQTNEEDERQVIEETNVNNVIKENLIAINSDGSKTIEVIDLQTSNDTPIEEENNELDEMIALIEEINENECCSVTNSSWEKIKNILPPVKSLDKMNVSIDFKLVNKENKHFENTSITTNSSEKIKCNLPTIKSLDTMHVSNCTNRTEATFNSIQNTRSNSPDLFADSDIEMEEERIDDTDNKIVNVLNVDKSDSSLEEAMTEVLTYEIYSSDEVKNTSSTEHNDMSTRSETLIHEQCVNAFIDLTQDDLKIHSPPLSTSKEIVEIDLFAESPSEDINCNSQPSKYLPATPEDTFKFTLSLHSPDNEPENTNERTTETLNDSIKLIHQNLKTKHCDIVEDDDDEDLVLREIGMDQTNISFLNFEGRKQLETSFHKETAVGAKEALNDDTLTANDIKFRELCSKYLKDVCEQPLSFKNKTDNYLGRSFTQPMTKIKTPQKVENKVNTSLDIMMMNMDNIKASRKSNSFNRRTPKKSKSSREFILSKSQSFNDQRSDISIDLTQNNDDDDDDDGIPQEDDDCLILSDDEINYSIWQANKTGISQTSDLSNNEEDAISIPDIEEENHDSIQEAVIEFPHKYHVEFDYMDLSSPPKPKESSRYLEMPATTSKPEKFNFDRSEFGILEEHSETIDYTSTLCTPTKHLNDVSFLNSPTEKTAPMKRYSNCQKSSQKFNELLKNLDEHSSMYNDFQDFDELDHLVYDSPLQKNTNSFKNPDGLEQLLTAEISFNKSQKSPLAKTPKKSVELSSTKQEFNYNSKTYTIRSIATPKPDYTNISESDLLKQLYNFGIKPLKRKQAVKMLEYIYNQTHPILLEDDVIERRQQDLVINMDVEPSTSKSCLQSLRKTSSLETEQNFSNRISHTIKKTSLSSQNVVNTKQTIQSLVSSQIIVEEPVKDGNNKLFLKDACGLEMLRYAIDLKAELFDENYILQTNVTKKTPQPLLPFHIAWYNLVCSNHKLHETILMYEPLDLQQIYLFLKGLGYRYDPKDLKIFFDRRCIIFRYDLAAAAGSSGKLKYKNRHIRESKKSKNRKKI